MVCSVSLVESAREQVMSKRLLSTSPPSPGPKTPVGFRPAKGGFGSPGPLRRVIVISLALPFAGCALVGPDFKKPTAPVAASYTDVDGKPISQLGGDASASKTEEIRDWWTVFHDPTLDRLIDTAYHQNLTLVSAGTRVLEARAELGIAVGEWYPQQQQVGGSVNYNRFSKQDAFAFANPPGNFWRASLGTALAWELDFWGKFRRGIESADASYLASIASYDDVLVTLLGDVATTYIGIRTVQKQIDLAQQNIARQRRALSIANDRFRNGATTRLDVYQAQAVLGATEARVPQLANQLQEGINVLHVLLGMPPSAINDMLAQSAGIPVAPGKIDLGIPADLLRRRPDIRTAEFRAAAQSAQIGVAKADLYPSFSLVGNIGLVSSNVGKASLGDIFTHGAVAYSFGPSFQWNILNYGQITNNVRVQDARLQALLVDYKNTVLKAQQEVENGIAAFVLSRQAADALRGTVTAADGALNLAFTQYQEGLSDFTTVLTAEQNLLESENALAVTMGQTATSLAMLYRALGGGWEIRAGKDFVPAATKDEMKNRTNWGGILQTPSEGQAVPPPEPSGPKKGPFVDAPIW